MAIRYYYMIEYTDEDGCIREFDTIAENNEDAITDFEIETGYDDFDIISCERSSL